MKGLDKGRLMLFARFGYCLLLGFYPRPFRKRYRLLMEEAFADDLDSAVARRGAAGRILTLGKTMLDYFSTLILEWMSVLRRSSRKSDSGEPPPRRPVWRADHLLQDVKLGLRTLKHSAGFVALAVLILALGIGANTTIFTIVNGLFFAPPPLVSEPDRLIRAIRTETEGSSEWWSYPDYAFVRDNNEVFSELCAYEPSGRGITVGTGDGARSMNAWYVTANYFHVLGVRPEAGRTFHPAGAPTPGASTEVVISHGFGQRFLGGKNEAVGSTIRLNEHPFEVIGVMPENFRGISPVEPPPDVWVPIMMQPVLTPALGNWLKRVDDERLVWLHVLGRLDPVVTFETAQANMDAVAASLGKEFPPPSTGDAQGVRLSRDYRFGIQHHDGLWTLTRMLMAVVGLVLLISGANVAILQLARAQARSKDVGIQMAMGAPRGRIVLQFLVESLFLAAAGGVAGYFLSFWSADLAARALPFTFGMNFNPDVRVLAFTMVAATLTSVLFGIAPALQASRTDVVSCLSPRDPGSTRSPIRSVLVVAQVALSIILVTGAVVFLRSLRAAEAVDLGFETERRLLVSLNLTHHGYEEDKIARFLALALERTSSVPGVVRASTTLQTPFRGRWQKTLAVPGAQTKDENQPASFNAVGPDYFQAMGIPLLAGRGMTYDDVSGAPRVVVMNEAAARKLWPGGEWLGRTIFLRNSVEPLTVVGIAANANYFELGEAPAPLVYVSSLQPFTAFMGRVSFLLQTSGDPLSVAELVQKEIHNIDPNLAITMVQTMDDCVERVLGRYRVGATVVSLFGSLALTLAAMGLYGVLSYLVVRRTRTIGIRMALGATQSRVALSVLADGLKFSLMGTAIGLPAAYASTQFIESFLYGVDPKGTATFAVVPLILAAVACLAGLFPAHRASRVNPMEALRME